MKHLHKKIEHKKNEIENRKKNLSQDYTHAKNKLIASSGGLLTFGGIALGFLLFPKKIRLLKSLLKAYTVSQALRQITELFPSSIKTEISENSIEKETIRKKLH